MRLTMREHGVILLIFALNLNIQAQTTKPEACSLPADGGQGSDEEVRVYMHYDAEKDNCYPFRYSGSGGNANRFITERQCMRNCSQRADELFPMNARQACSLPKKPGECTGHYLRYYYSPEHHTCKSFYWSGCVGNGNRFLTLSMCNMTCYNAADEGLQDYSGESDVPIGIILGVVFGLIGAVILVVVIVFGIKHNSKPSSKKKGGKKDEKSTEQPLKEQAIEMGGGEAQPATLEVSTIQS